MNINWKVRLLNPTFWANIAIAVILPILAYFGLSWQDMTSWAALGGLFISAIQNPVIIVSVIVSVWNALHDPTTKGFSDSEQALTYTEPK